MTFESLNLDARLLKALDICGYKNPTPIQARCIPQILNGRDIVASAQTGTGKTAAFVLPLLNRISTNKKDFRPKALILSPTRELAGQITQAIAKYGKFLRFSSANLVGGMPYPPQIRELSRPVDVIVATPGRLLDHLDRGRLDLSGIELLILDEADRMLDMGFIDDVKNIAKLTPPERQTLLFSATVDDKISKVIQQLLKNPERIEISYQEKTPVNIQQKLYLTDNIQHKNKLLDHFLKNESIFKAIIFSATKIHADKLANELCHNGFKAAALHGDLKQAKRNRTIQDLQRGKIQFLVATDVAARGIDIADITHVFNFDLPRFCEDYVHRIGRTGRAGKSGIAISFVAPNEKQDLVRIERFTQQKFQLQTIAGLEPSKAMLGLAPKKKSFRHKRPSGNSHFPKSQGFKKRFAERV